MKWLINYVRDLFKPRSLRANRKRKLHKYFLVAASGLRMKLSDEPVPVEVSRNGVMRKDANLMVKTVNYWQQSAAVARAFGRPFEYDVKKCYVMDLKEHELEFLFSKLKRLDEYKNQIKDVYYRGHRLEWQEDIESNNVSRLDILHLERVFYDVIRSN